VGARPRFSIRLRQQVRSLNAQARLRRVYRASPANPIAARASEASCVGSCNYSGGAVEVADKTGVAVRLVKSDHLTCAVIEGVESPVHVRDRGEVEVGRADDGPNGCRGIDRPVKPGRELIPGMPRRT
jgi:hypothetical protein